MLLIENRDGGEQRGSLKTKTYLNLYLSGLSAHSGAGRPPQKDSKETI